MIERILSFAEQYRPGITRTLRGVTAEELAALEELAQQTLPPSCREFFLSMGRFSGAMLTRFSGFDFSFRVIHEFYSEADPAPPKQFFCIARNSGGGDQDWFLDLRSPGQEPPVVLMNYYWWASMPSPRPPLSVVFEDLEGLLLVAAFLSVRLAALPNAGVFSSGRQPLPGDRQALAELAAGFGLTALPKTGPDQRCYNGEHLAMYVRQPAGSSGVRLELGARDPRLFADASEQIRARLSMIQVQ